MLARRCKDKAPTLFVKNLRDDPARLPRSEVGSLYPARSRSMEVISISRSERSILSESSSGRESVAPDRGFTSASEASEASQESCAAGKAAGGCLEAGLCCGHTVYSGFVAIRRFLLVTGQVCTIFYVIVSHASAVLIQAHALSFFDERFGALLLQSARTKTRKRVGWVSGC